jgi:hypothetical protein
MIRVFNRLSAGIFLVWLITGTAWAQQSMDFALDWAGDRPSLAGQPGDGEIHAVIVDPGNEGATLVIRFPLSGNAAFNYSLDGLEWKNGDEPFENDIPSRATSYEGTARKERFGFIEIPLLTAANNDRGRLASIRISVSRRPGNARRSSSRTYSGNSLLATGQWFKFGVPETGVYRLTYEFLETLGIDVDGIAHAEFRVYGHRGGMLPKRAGDERIDDLEEVPLSVSASANSLQPGEFLYFYAEGPEKWTWDEDKNRFIHEHHLYSDVKTYFITASLGTGKRVQQVIPPPGAADVAVDEFQDHAYIEEDIYNLNKSGSDWLGDEFAVNLQKTYSFNFPGLIAAESVIADYRVAARTMGGPSSFDVLYGGSVQSSTGIGPVDDSYTAPVARSSQSAAEFNAAGEDVDITLRFDPLNFSAKGWLDYIAVNATSALNFTGNDLLFRHRSSLDNDLVEYRVSGVGPGTEIWDVTDQFNTVSINYSLNGGTAVFKAEGGRMAQFAALGTPINEPVALGYVPNQDLHGLTDADMIIITREAMLGPANELAAFHRQEEGYRVHVVTVSQIFNEFSAGTNDVTAIRDFLKMFYDRNDNYPAYVCLFGDGTFNNRDLGDYYVPTYEGENTLTTLATLVSDDFFAFLDDDEGSNINDNSNMLDVAVGRIPADNLSKANIAVEKIRRYYSNTSYGSWRNVGAYVADDEDLNIHIDDAQIIADEFIGQNPVMNVEKIYLDAFRQVAAAGGGIYPDVNQAINNRMFKGTLYLNYIGHGGGNGLADERVVTLEDIASWDNENKLTLIISATCEFTRYDDFERYSAGERAFFKQDGGAIALVTTVRLVFSNKNFEMNQSFMNSLEQGYADPDLTLGDIILDAKNNTPTGSGNRKFTLIGDPALRLAFPEHQVRTTSINARPFVVGNDTLKALTRVDIEGEVLSSDGELMNDFNGLVYPTVYDKVKTLQTLGNDPRSQIIPFDVQNSIIYSGKIQASAGRFSYAFVVPRDIVYAVGNGKISYYAHDDVRDAAGIDTVLIGGGGQLDSNSIDNDDPLVEVFIDDETWISGDFTDRNPDLLVKLFDENGINTVGSGVGHDIVAVLDEDTQNGIVLNDFYESELNSYQRGEVFYPLEEIEPGTHSIRVKAWDVFNNSGEGYTEFVVADGADLALDHVLNYPNPFTTNTRFMFEHNRKGDVLDVRIEIFTVSGKVVKTLQQTEVSTGRRVEIAWDGLDDYGDRLGRGVYIYRVTLKDSSGEKVDEYQKLVLLR